MTELTITSAKPLSIEKKEELERIFLYKYTEFNVKYIVNDAIIGGIIIFDGENVINGSVMKQLDNLREAIKDRL